MDEYKSFGDLIKSKRIAKKWTAYYLAQVVGTTTVTISNIENNKGKPSPQTFARLTRELGIDIEEAMDYYKGYEGEKR